MTPVALSLNEAVEHFKNHVTRLICVSGDKKVEVISLAEANAFFSKPQLLCE